VEVEQEHARLELRGASAEFGRGGEAFDAPPVRLEEHRQRAAKSFVVVDDIDAPRRRGFLRPVHAIAPLRLGIITVGSGPISPKWIVSPRIVFSIEQWRTT
jgi:hypothetical protein